MCNRALVNTVCSYNAETFGYGWATSERRQPASGRRSSSPAHTDIATPSCANRYLFTDLARGVWAFNGYVTTDCGGAAGLGPAFHRYTSGENEVCVLRPPLYVSSATASRAFGLANALSAYALSVYAHALP